MDLQKDNQFLQRRTIKWQLIIYDIGLLFLITFPIICIYPSSIEFLTIAETLLQVMFIVVSVFVVRLFGGVYNLIWRYGGTKEYLRLIICDAIAGIIYFTLQLALPVKCITFIHAVTIITLDLLAAIIIRLIYQSLYEYSSSKSVFRSFLKKITTFLTGFEIEDAIAITNIHKNNYGRCINIAIVGAGRVGVMLAEELLNNPNAAYEPKCFIDVDQSKVGRYIYGIQVLSETEATIENLSMFPIQEIVFAIPDADVEKKKNLYEQYRKTGCKLKVYDYPITKSVTNGKRHLREFDIEELLFRQARDFINDQTRDYYKGKKVLISGGGGSIGSELSRQIAKMNPKQLIILDIYENCAYDIQQELKISYGNELNLEVEIVSICDKSQLEKIFKKYKPDIVLHAAAHKHVPLMEHNCCEAVKNNIFGTLNMVEMSEKYAVGKFTMISTDKAVNPTNVMGATKRMCEMIVQSRTSQTNFSATRFGNVLGSNGSVIPLFKKQIANGGPITVTDRRIIRYFMTIPEASQLVLVSGAMAKNGELYVLDMGDPVRILDLAENMIRLSGYEPYKDIDIIETGLRPGEKLYEELLIKNEDLDKTDNSMIFIERDKPITTEKILSKLDILQKALLTENDEIVKKAMMQVVPTFHSPEEVNATAVETEEMKNVKVLVSA